MDGLVACYGLSFVDYFLGIVYVTLSLEDQGCC